MDKSLVMKICYNHLSKWEVSMKQVLVLIVFVVVLLAGLSNWYRASNIGSAPSPIQSISSGENLPTTAPRDSAVSKVAKPSAPDIVSDTWLNSPVLTSADMLGKVVVVEFWTFG